MQLADNPRDLCLFTLGINTAYRANELLSITVGQVDYLAPGDRLDLKQTKNKKNRATTLNATVIEAIDNWLKVHPDTSGVHCAAKCQPLLRLVRHLPRNANAATTSQRQAFDNP